MTWIVNNFGELGVRVGSRSFFMYKGRSLECSSDDGAMTYRPVYKQEFGEVISRPTDVEGGEFFPLFRKRH